MHNFRNKNVPIDDAMMERTRQGSVKGKKIKAVCMDCNTVWMSAMETAVKPILLPLMYGQPTLLDRSSRWTLTEWIVLKALVSEHASTRNSPPDPLFDQEARDRFKATREIPSGFRIWIGMHNGLKWQSALYRHSAGLVPFDSPLPSDTRRKNTQTITFGLRQLLIYVFATTSTELYALYELNGLSRHLRPLWPLKDEDIRWKPFYVVDDDYADGLSAALQNLMNSPTTAWDDVDLRARQPTAICTPTKMTLRSSQWAEMPTSRATSPLVQPRTAIHHGRFSLGGELKRVAILLHVAVGDEPEQLLPLGNAEGDGPADVAEHGDLDVCQHLLRVQEPRPSTRSSLTPGRTCGIKKPAADASRAG
ncbi:hypothetical protein QWJ07_26220 [Frankia sp. RB7]|nr:hypothetical protein [Frankia sp. RB7]